MDNRTLHDIKREFPLYARFLEGHTFGIPQDFTNERNILMTAYHDRLEAGEYQPGAPIEGQTEAQLEPGQQIEPELQPDPGENPEPQPEPEPIAEPADPPAEPEPNPENAPE